MDFSFSLEDNSPPNQPVDYSSGSIANSTVQSQMAQINGSIVDLSIKIDSKASSQDLENFKQSIDQTINSRNNTLMSNILILLLVYTVFFFAIFFLAISKGWLVNGK